MTYLLAMPVPFGTKHLIGTITVLVLVTLSLFFLLKIFKIKNHGRVLKIATVILLFLEVLKQTKGIIDAGEYPLWALPFQLCSVPLYLFPIVAFSKGKFRDFLLPGTYTISLCAALAMLAYPSTVLGTTDVWIPLEGNYFPLVSFSFHGIMIFFALYMVFSGIYQPRLRDYPKAYGTLVFFAIVAIVVNSIFKTTDMMFLNTGYGMPFSFLLYDFNRFIYYAFMALLAFVVLTIPFIPFVIKRKKNLP